MNTIAGTFLMLWLTGWTLACVWAGSKARGRAAGSGTRGNCRGLGSPISN